MHKGGSGSGTSRGVVVVGKDGGVKVWFQGGVSHLFAVLLHYLVTMCLLCFAVVSESLLPCFHPENRRILSHGHHIANLLPYSHRKPSTRSLSTSVMAAL